MGHNCFKTCYMGVLTLRCGDVLGTVTVVSRLQNLEQRKVRQSRLISKERTQTQINNTQILKEWVSWWVWANVWWEGQSWFRLQVPFQRVLLYKSTQAIYTHMHVCQSTKAGGGYTYRLNQCREWMRTWLYQKLHLNMKNFSISKQNNSPCHFSSPPTKYQPYSQCTRLVWSAPLLLLSTPEP